MKAKAPSPEGSAMLLLCAFGMLGACADDAGTAPVFVLRDAPQERVVGSMPTAPPSSCHVAVGSLSTVIGPPRCRPVMRKTIVKKCGAATVQAPEIFSLRSSRALRLPAP